MLSLFQSNAGTQMSYEKCGFREFLQGKVFPTSDKHIVTFSFWISVEIAHIHPSSKLEYLLFFKETATSSPRSFTPGSSLATELRKSTEDLQKRQDLMTKPWWQYAAKGFPMVALYPRWEESLQYHNWQPFWWSKYVAEWHGQLCILAHPDSCWPVSQWFCC